MSTESPAANPVAERYLKLSKAYVKLANRYASLDVEHGKLRRVLIKLLLSYRDLKKELADAHEKIQFMEEQNQELQQFQALLDNEFLSALEEAEQAETKCERLLSQEDQSLKHLALEVDEAVKQLEANLPIDVIGTEQPVLEEATSAHPEEAPVPSEPTEDPITEVASEAAVVTEVSETQREVLEPEEEPIYEVVQEAHQEPIAAEAPAPSDAEEELVYEIAQEPLTPKMPVSGAAEVTEEVPVEVSAAMPAEETKPPKAEQASPGLPASPSDDWDLALGFFDVA